MKLCAEMGRHGSHLCYLQHKGSRTDSGGDEVMVSARVTHSVQAVRNEAFWRWTVVTAQFMVPGSMLDNG